MRRALLLLALALAAVSPRPARSDTDITFIVNRDNPVQSLTREDLIDYYQKRKRQWPDGSSVRFIDHDPGSPARSKFLSSYLNTTESDIDLFWFAQKIHSGDSMPTQISSDSLVIEIVKSFKGAIGYILSSTPLSTSQVKKITIASGGKG